MNLSSSLLFSDKREIESAYVITLSNHQTSKLLSLRCQQSCHEIKQPIKVWEAFDGTNEKDIIIPESLVNQNYVYWIKKPNNKYSTSQIACFFSHLSLWAHCATIDRPIIVLEHDAIMIKRLQKHNFYNCIQYLGNQEQFNQSKVPIGLPPHGSIYEGHWRFICRAHAYAIDPPVARNLLSYAIREGVTKTLDVFIRCDIFAIVQDGMYAYDKRDISTINEKEDYSEDA